MIPRPGLTKYRYLSPAFKSPVAAQVGWRSLRVTSSRALGSPSIAIYRVPAPWAPASKSPVAHQWLPRWAYAALKSSASHALGSPSIAIYSVPAAWARQVSLFTVFPCLGSPSIAIYRVPAPWAPSLCGPQHVWGELSVSVKSESLSVTQDTGI